MNGPRAPQSVVFIIDDDPSLRSAMELLFRSVGLQAEVLATTAEFLGVCFRVACSGRGGLDGKPNRFPDGACRSRGRPVITLAPGPPQ
jgi:hypothetical protein